MRSGSGVRFCRQRAVRCANAEAIGQHLTATGCLCCPALQRAKFNQLTLTGYVAYAVYDSHPGK
jgi:hypothetical protein